MGNARQTGSEAATRRLVGSWLSRTSLDPGSGDTPPAAGLAVPEAPAGEVIATARRLATRGRRPGPCAQPPSVLRVVAETLVLDAHPSAAGWTDAERREALDWVTLIIHRFGEDGIQHLVGELNARR
jgi:hypothetical protein